MEEDVEDELGTCCADDWRIWLRAETWIWAFLLIVQLSMVVFLVVHGRKEKTFRQAFFAFFVAVTVVDCVLVLLRTTREWDETIFGTQYDYSLTPDGSPSLRDWISDLTISVVVPTFCHAQPLFLTAIAANRFTAFCLPLKHSRIWRRRTVVAVVAAVAVASTLLGIVCPVASIVQQAVVCSAATRKHKDKLRCAEIWAFDHLYLPLALLAFTSAICCIVSLALNVASVTTLIVHRATGKLQQKGPEFRLFVHSIYMFLLQILIAFQDFVGVMDHPYFVNEELRIEGFPWARVPHSTQWLAGVKGEKEWFFEELYFWPGCVVAEQYVRGGTHLPLCSAWYRLLVGELRLREGTATSGAITIRTIEQCLLALSGSVALLLISGNVRRAYFHFYLRRNCTLKKHRSRATTIVVR